MGKTMSVMQLEANRTNAEKSTGPKTAEGKQIVARNAVKHGLFSRHLVVSDEDPSEYQALLYDLHAALNPVGALEYYLVERIAITLWRQRRLVRSETAAVELDRKARNIAEAVTIQLGISPYSDNKITEDDLAKVDKEQLDWCKSVLAEYETLNPTTLTDWQRLEKDAPLIFEQLASDVEDEHQSIPDYLAEWDEPQGYFADLMLYCRNQIAKGEQRPMILAVAEMVRSKRAILRGDARDALAKYQVMLDNELYKAFKALREAQEWRMNSIEAAPYTDGFVSENAGAQCS